MRKKLFLVLLCFPALITAQNLSGQWQGILFQPNKTDTFYYQINIQQTDQSISGTSYSRSPDGKTSAHFTLTGAWDGKQLILQEIEQTQPQQPRWCLKYAVLQYSQKNNTAQLSGDWKADNCTPGILILQQQMTENEQITESEKTFTWAGRWTGQLTQSDRDYGFYYELKVEEMEKGQSYIVSEANGGSANHDLNWSFNPKDSTFLVKELQVVNKTDPKWKWCIKSAQLHLRKDANLYKLEGTWQGHLEGHTPLNGKCASGSIYLEKPIENQQFTQTQQSNSQTYETKSQREVRISRTIEVQKPNIRIRVWDSGTVDGDIVTLFLNGKQILDKHQVNKSKYAINVTLAEDNNFLILHAEDLGDIPPNTIAVSVDDGVKEQILVLSSDLKTSGAVLVKQFKIR